MSDVRLLVKAEDVTDHMLVLAGNCVEDWFTPERSMSEDEFIDRFCAGYLYPEGWDIENLDTPAVRKIMRSARRARREL